MQSTFITENQHSSMVIPRKKFSRIRKKRTQQRLQQQRAHATLVAPCNERTSLFLFFPVFPFFFPFFFSLLYSTACKIARRILRRLWKTPKLISSLALQVARTATPVSRKYIMLRSKRRRIGARITRIQGICGYGDLQQFLNRSREFCVFRSSHLLFSLTAPTDSDYICRIDYCAMRIGLGAPVEPAVPPCGGYR